MSLERDCSDGLLLTTAYQRWGADMARRLVGDFAIVVWDWRQRLLLGLRDHVGVKPLYYFTAGSKVAIATDVAVLIELANPPPIPDDRFVIEHLLMEYRSTDRTFWSQVKRLPGGHALSARPGHHEVVRYWFPPTGEFPPKPTGEVHQELQQLFFAAVERRLDSETPLLCHLSGGMDSSSVTCVADEIYKRGDRRPPLTVASALYPGIRCDESEFIRTVTDRVGFQAEGWDARADGISPFIAPSLLGPAMVPEPSGDMKIATRIGARALLSGLGGDHVFASDGVLEDLAQARSTGSTLFRLVDPRVSFGLRVRRARFLARRLAPLSIRRRIGSVRGRRRAPTWMLRRWDGLVGDLAMAGYPDPAHRSLSSIEGRHWETIGSGSLGLALDIEQHRAAVSGLEFRYPFLDLRLIEYALRVPVQHWPPSAPYARLHREFLAAHLPKAVTRRPKATFSVGVANRMRLCWPTIRSLFFEGDWLSSRYVDRLGAQALIAAGEASTDDDDWPLWRGIWGIATVEAWLRKISRYSTGPKRRNG